MAMIAGSVLRELAYRLPQDPMEDRVGADHLHDALVPLRREVVSPEGSLDTAIARGLGSLRLGDVVRVEKKDPVPGLLEPPYLQMGSRESVEVHAVAEGLFVSPNANHSCLPFGASVVARGTVVRQVRTAESQCPPSREAQYRGMPRTWSRMSPGGGARHAVFPVHTTRYGEDGEPSTTTTRADVVRAKLTHMSERYMSLAEPDPPPGRTAR